MSRLGIFRRIGELGDMDPIVSHYGGMSGQEERFRRKSPKRFELDVQYVENWSLLADAKILVDTVLVVLGRKGIAEAGQATMTEFQGSGSAQSASATA